MPTLSFDDLLNVLPLAGPSGSQTQTQDKQDDTAKHGDNWKSDNVDGLEVRLEMVATLGPLL